MKRITGLMLLAILVAVLSMGCVPGDGKNNMEKPAGFFTGVWHGWIAPVSLIISLFDKNSSVFERYNTGWWYNFGFYIAIVGGFGGISFTRSKFRSRSRRHEE